MTSFSDMIDEVLFNERRRLNQLADTFFEIDPDTGENVFERLERVDDEITKRL